MNADTKPHERLLSEFPPATPGEWRDAAEKLLKGAPFEKRMITPTPEGIDLLPIYAPPADQSGGPVARPEEPGSYPFRRGSAAPAPNPPPWLIAQELPYPTYEEFNKALRDDLERGQTAIFLPLDLASRLGVDPDQADASTIGSRGVSIASVAGYGKALTGIDLSSYPLFIEAGSAGPLFLALAAADARKKHPDRPALRGCIGSDPLGVLASEGRLLSSLEVLYDEMAVAAEWADKYSPELRTIVVSTSAYHDGGASAVEELACAVGTAAAYVRELVLRGVSPDIAVHQIWFSFSVGSQFFMEIAKLRAARVLWANVASAFGVHGKGGAMAMHVRTSATAMTRIDPYVNMLRVTTEALAGAIGGCSSMHVGFFDEAIRRPDEFSRRIARNVQVLLQAESHIHRVVDPAGGSWYVEALTESIAERAWKLFQKIEEQGGMAAALQNGFVRNLIAESARRRAEALALRRSVMVGVNAYANPLEASLEEGPDDLDSVRSRRAETLKNLRTKPDRAAENEVLDRLSRILETGRDSIMNALIEAAGKGATLGELRRAWRARRETAEIRCEPVSPYRCAKPFEEIRAASNASAALKGNRPSVFLATMGPQSQHKARADFVADFLAAGGLTTVMGTGYASAEEAVDAAINSGAPGLVICSTDETYPALVPAMCAAIKKRAPSMMIMLAGYPADHVESFRGAGVEVFIHIRANVLEVLRQMLTRMGVTG